MTIVRQPTTDTVPKKRPTSDWRSRLLLGYFTVSGVGVVVLWILYLVGGTASTNLTQPVMETGLTIGRSTGATAAALLLLLVGTGIRQGSPRARGVAMVAIGAFGYATLNTLGETMAQGSAATLILVPALVGVPIALVLLGRSRRTGGGTAVFVLALAVPASWLVVWSLNMADAGPFDGIEVVTLPLTHYAAELIMAITTLVGLAAWARRRLWGRPVALAGLGTYVYSTLNAIDWAVVNDPTLTPILAVTCVVAVLGAAHLIGLQPARN